MIRKIIESIVFALVLFAVALGSAKTGQPQILTEYQVRGRSIFGKCRVNLNQILIIAVRQTVLLSAAVKVMEFNAKQPYLKVQISYGCCNCSDNSTVRIPTEEAKMCTSDADCDSTELCVETLSRDKTKVSRVGRLEPKPTIRPKVCVRKDYLIEFKPCKTNTECGQNELCYNLKCMPYQKARIIQCFIK